MDYGMVNLLVSIFNKPNIKISEKQSDILQLPFQWRATSPPVHSFQDSITHEIKPNSTHIYHNKLQIQTTIGRFASETDRGN